MRILNNQSDRPISRSSVCFSLLLLTFGMLEVDDKAMAATPPGNAMIFNGSTDIQFPASYSNMNFSGSSNFTISMWFKGNNALYKQRSLVTGDYEIYLVNSNGQIVFGLGKGNVGWDFFATSTPLDNTIWNHVALTKAGSTASLYINGQLNKQATASGSLTAVATAGSMYIGSDNGGNQFIGQMDEVQIWNYAQSQAQIYAGMYNALVGNETGLVAYYNFDSNSAQDLTANGYHGSIIGTANWTASEAMPPFPISATNVTSSGFSTTWNVVSGATKYRIDVSSDAAFSTLVASNIDVGAGTSFDLTGLTLPLGTQHYYRMRVEKGVWTSPNSAPVMLSPGNMLSFNGTSRYVMVPYQSTLNSSQFTAEAWAKVSGGTGAYRTVIGNRLPSPLGGFLLRANNSNRWDFILGGGGSWQGVTGPNIILNQWLHLAATYDGSNAKFYINGVLQGTQTITSYQLNTGQPFVIGCYNDNLGLCFNGQIDEVRIWNVARTQADIQGNMYKTLAGNEAGLVAYYSLDQPSGTFTPDLTGHKHDGTLVNNPTWTTATWNYGYPYIATGTVSAITDLSASIGGNVIADGIPSLSASGICYGTGASPTTPCTTGGATLGTFTSALTGLTPNTLYYAREYATNARATAYGNDVTFTTLMGNQVITFSPPTSAIYGDAPLTLTATGGNSGNPVTFTSTTTSVCTTGGTNGATLTIVAAGTCNITANQAGNANYNPAAPVNGSILINKANQVISFSPPTSVTYGGGSLTLTATGGGSGNPVTFTSTTTSVCTTGGTNGATLTIVAAGTCNITANQAGNANYNPAAPVNGSILLNKANQVISFSPPTNVTYGGGSLTLTATGGSSGNPVTFTSMTTDVCTTGGTNGATLMIVNAGTCTVTANQLGNGNYLAAPPVSQNLGVTPATQTILFTPLIAASIGEDPLTLTATATSGLPVTFTSLTPNVCTVGGTQLLIVNAGTCTVTANQQGNANYQAAPQVSQETNISPIVQHTLDLTLAGTGQGSVTSDPVGLNCSATRSACTLTVEGSSRWVYLTATPDTGSTFVGWSGDPACTENAPGKVFLLQNMACIATFELKSYTLTVEKNVPGVTVTGEGLDCQDTPQGFVNLQRCNDSSCTPPPDSLETPGCQATYPYNTTVKLAVTTPRKWEFLGWEGSCDPQGQVTVTQNHVCRPKFGSDPNIPNTGDGNGDGILDARQDNVMSLPDKVAGNYITLAVNPECVIAEGSTLLASSLDKYDPKHPAPQGLMYFEIQCSQTLVTMYFHGVTRVPRNAELLKYGPTTPGDEKTVGWYKLPNVQFGLAMVGGKPVATVTYTLIDGQLGDNTGVDGKIVDPVGLGE